jgi:hypothetical protein
MCDDDDVPLFTKQTFGAAADDIEEVNIMQPLVAARVLAFHLISKVFQPKYEAQGWDRAVPGPHSAAFVSSPLWRGTD